MTTIRKIKKTFLKGLIWELIGVVCLVLWTGDWGFSLAWTGFRVVTFVFYERIWKLVRRQYLYHRGYAVEANETLKRFAKFSSNPHDWDKDASTGAGLGHCPLGVNPFIVNVPKSDEK